MDFKTLRKKYPLFVFEKYSYAISKKNLTISFVFKIKPDIEFNPEIIIKNIDERRIKKISKKILNNLIFNLGLIEMISYWKATCSPQIHIQAGGLNVSQKKWWMDLLINGMGEFFYINKIDFKNKEFLKISSEVPDNAIYADETRNRILIPIGGGKDSVVTVESLKKWPAGINCFSLNPTKPSKEIMKLAGCKDPIIVERKIDKKLLELNQKEFLNGHTPFSAYLAFLSILLGVVFDYRFIALSNERSSNEGNIKYLNTDINHQYSKSWDFEKKFRGYSKKYLVKDIEYFSFLRPLYEIQIAKLFSAHEKYFPVFLSCNEANKTTSGTKKPKRNWCGACSKCLFVYMALYPFADTEKLIKIFGKDLLNDKKLLPILEQLIGDGDFKPFECVGTHKESLALLYLILEKTDKPYLLKYFEKKISKNSKILKNDSDKILNSWDNKNYLPKEFNKILKDIYNLK